MIGDLGSVVVPKLVAKIGDIGLGHGRKPVAFGPISYSKKQLVVELLFGREDFVCQRAFRNDSKVWLEMGVKKRTG